MVKLLANGFETKRLFATPMCLDDANYVVDLKSRKEVYQFFANPHPLSLEEHLNWFEKSYLPDDKRVEFILKTKLDSSY